MAKKITLNGKEYNFEDLPEDMKKILGNPDQNGGADMTNVNIASNNRVYKNFNDLPPELQEKLRKNLGKLKNVPFAKNILKMYGMDENQLNSFMDNNSFGGSSFGGSTGNNPSGGDSFGGSSFNTSSGSPFKQSSNSLMTPPKNNSGAIITAIILVGVGGFIAMMFFGINFIGSSWAETFALQGDPTHFDPVASVNEVRSHIDPNAKLSSLSIMYVRSDGTMDLKATAYKPTATYDFYRELAQPPKDAPPVGAGGTTTGKWYEPVEAEVYEPGQWRSVTKMGGGVSTEYSYSNKGIDLDRSDPTATPDDFVDDPKCSMADLWKIAIQKGAPSDAVASVDYNHDGYNFYISNADVNLDFGFDCKIKTDG